jgi:hypothetical protein
MLADPNLATPGAYGLAIDFPVLPGMFVDAPASWPTWRFAYDVETQQPARAEEWSDTGAVLHVVPAGLAFVNRTLRTTRFSLPEAVSVDAFAHPHLASTAVAAGQWSGSATFHAGCFVHNGGVWAVLGGKEAGKSSTIAWLHTAGFGILADDLLVASEGIALAGPRCLDLREGAAEHFGIGRYLGEIGNRTRWRVTLPMVEAELPLAGWISLAWGDDVSVRKLDGPRQFTRLVANRAFLATESRPESWLGLLGLPMYELTRPRHWASLDNAMAELLAVLGH